MTEDIEKYQKELESDAQVILNNFDHEELRFEKMGNQIIKCCKCGKRTNPIVVSTNPFKTKKYFHCTSCWKILTQISNQITKV